jgi:hypothetical protein
MSNYSDGKEDDAPVQITSGWPFGLAVAFAVTLVAGTVVLLVWVFVRDVPDQLWTRVMTLFNVIASLGYAGVGALFGHQVQQVNLNAEQKRTRQAQRKITEMKKDATAAMKLLQRGEASNEAKIRADELPQIGAMRFLQSIIEK